MSTEG